MEPMALGSPGGSPAGVGATSPYLPSFLMGDAAPPSTPRSNTLSPTKARTAPFAPNSPTGLASPPDFGNRSGFEPRPMFGNSDTPKRGNLPNTIRNHNPGVSGPPTQGLFDLLRAERNQVQTPAKPYPLNQSLQMGTPVLNNCQNQSMNESYLNQSSFNTSRITSPLPNLNMSEYRNNYPTLSPACYPEVKHCDFWITVFGFPQSAASMILSHFSQCGTIIDKVFPPQSGNWVHIKFSSRLECDKALNYNEKVLGNNIMIGVTHCKDASIVDKENMCDNNQASRVRPLSQTAYKSVQCESAVVACSTTPQRSSGLVNKAMDLLFGW